MFLCVYAESSLSALFSSSCCVCTFLHILLLPPQKITLCFFVYLQHMFGFFFIYILASSTLYLLSPRSTESLDVFCWSCSVLRLNPLCTQFSWWAAQAVAAVNVGRVELLGQSCYGSVVRLVPPQCAWVVIQPHYHTLCIAEVSSGWSSASGIRPD